VVEGAAEIRIHQVTAPAGYRVRDGGHALAAAVPLELHDADGVALAHRADGLTSAVRALHGYTRAGVVTAEAANAFGKHSATPYVIADGHPGGTAVYVSLVLLAVTAEEPPTPDVRVEGDRVVLGRTITVHLGETPTCERRA
jgi:hypothetical protein